MTNPKFTIFTGFYNYTDTLEHLYESIKNQTYSNWEWLVCDDFSESSEVLNALKELESRDKRIRVIYPKWKKHYYWNLPLSESDGDFILVQDSDDLMHAKLLECYAYHFQKFPEVAIIGATSIIKNDSPLLGPTGAKRVNYNGASNFIEALHSNVYSISGDARAYRKSAIMNRGEIARDGEYVHGMGDDVLKMTNYEECGKFFCLPRALHDYTIRAGSVSGPTWEFRENADLIREEDRSMIRKAISRRGGKDLESIFDYYDSSFDSLYQFFHTGLGKAKYRARVEYYNSSLTAKKRNRIREIYFDHDISFGSRIDYPTHLVFSIGHESDIEGVKERLLERDESLVEITVTINLGLGDKIGDIRVKTEEALRSCGINGWYYIDYGCTTYCINTKDIL